MTTTATAPRLKERYREAVVPALMKEFNYPNTMAAPRLVKIVVNVGLGEAIQNARALDAATRDIESITGQHPVITRAKRSVAAFRLRAGMPIGLVVTLRGDRMWFFLDRLVNASLPRIRDFRGVPTKAFDGHGNYSLGLKEQLMFPEIEYDKIDKVRGLEITVVTTAGNDEAARQLLSLLGMPFAKD